MVQLTKVTRYYGPKRALGPVSFEIAKGDTVGILGLNGVGKTTLLRILACGLRPSAGSVRIDGHDVLDNPHEVRKRVGYLPEVPPVYGDMTVRDYLAFAGRLKGMTADAVAERIPVVEESTRITVRCGTCPRATSPRDTASASGSPRRSSTSRTCSSWMSPPTTSTRCRSSRCAP